MILTKATENLDGSVQVKGTEHHKITREKNPAFAGIAVGVISLPIPLGKRITAFALYQSVSLIPSSGNTACSGI